MTMKVHFFSEILRKYFLTEMQVAFYLLRDILPITT